MIAATAHSAPQAEPTRALVYAEDSPMREVEELCARIAVSDATVLLTGETGCGKEVLGRLVHERSGRKNKPFVPVNCAAIPESLLESELFGHARGAFTGASTSRAGRVALAEGGTLFLDEIGELPLPMQAKILRLIQERVYEPVGSTRPIAANFRLVAATNRDLAEEVAAGRFRQDLYFRLLVCPVHLPPLRERRSDIGILFDHFWSKRGETRKLSLEVTSLLQTYDWPGNVREMENLVQRLSVCARGERLEVSDLPQYIRGVELALEVASLQIIEEDERITEERAQARRAPVRPPVYPPIYPIERAAQQPSGLDVRRLQPADLPAQAAAQAPRPASTEVVRTEPALPALPAPSQPALPIDLPAMLRAMEDSYIAAALESSRGNKALAAQMLGMQRTTLTEKLRRRAATRAGEARAAASHG